MTEATKTDQQIVQEIVENTILTDFLREWLQARPDLATNNTYSDDTKTYSIEYLDYIPAPNDRNEEHVTPVQVHNSHKYFRVSKRKVMGLTESQIFFMLISCWALDLCGDDVHRADAIAISVIKELKMPLSLIEVSIIFTRFKNDLPPGDKINLYRNEERFRNAEQALLGNKTNLNYMSKTEPNQIIKVTLRKIGNSHGFIIPNNILNELGNRESATFIVEAWPDKLIIRPSNNPREGWEDQIKKAGPDELLIPDTLNDDNEEL